MSTNKKPFCKAFKKGHFTPLTSAFPYSHMIKNNPRSKKNDIMYTEEQIVYII